MNEIIPLTVSISQAVTITGMGRTWLYAAIKRRQLKVRKAGRRTLIEVCELQRFVKSLPPSDASQNAA